MNQGQTTTQVIPVLTPELLFKHLERLESKQDSNPSHVSRIAALELLIDNMLMQTFEHYAPVMKIDTSLFSKEALKSLLELGISENPQMLLEFPENSDSEQQSTQEEGEQTSVQTVETTVEIDNDGKVSVSTSVDWEMISASIPVQESLKRLKQVSKNSHAFTKAYPKACKSLRNRVPELQTFSDFEIMEKLFPIYTDDIPCLTDAYCSAKKLTTEHQNLIYPYLVFKNQYPTYSDIEIGKMTQEVISNAIKTMDQSEPEKLLNSILNPTKTSIQKMYADTEIHQLLKANFEKTPLSRRDRDNNLVEFTLSKNPKVAIPMLIQGIIDTVSPDRISILSERRSKAESYKEKGEF